MLKNDAAKNTDNWKPLLPQALKAHNKMMHEALMGNADPNETYDEENKNLAFELRKQAGQKWPNKTPLSRATKRIGKSKVASVPILAVRISGAEDTVHSTLARSG